MALRFESELDATFLIKSIFFLFVPHLSSDTSRYEWDIYAVKSSYSTTTFQLSLCQPKKCHYGRPLAVTDSSLGESRAVVTNLVGLDHVR